MRELLPLIAFISVTFSSLYLGVGTRRTVGTVQNSPTSLPNAPSEGRTAENVAAEPFATKALRQFHGIPAEAARSEDAPRIDTGVGATIRLDGLSAEIAFKNGTGRAAAKSQHTAYQAQPSEFFTDAQRADVKVMIGIVSDPIESSVHHFDQSLDAIQRAFEAEGYVIDRHELAWGDARSRVATGDSALHRHKAGALLFRKKRDVDATLQNPLTAQTVLMLVVGENPIAGIHKEALHDALDFLSAWQTPANAAKTLDVHILGPTYSGSALSLQIGLRTWFEKQSRDVFVQILSGSAMAKDNKDYLEMRLSNKRQNQLVVNFHATFPTTQDILTSFQDHYLSRLGISAHDMVLLTEANTAYGKSSTSSGEQDEDILRISYPVSIGQMRAAYERQDVLRLPIAGQTNSTGLRGLELHLEQNSRATDLPPTFSEATPAHVERVVVALLDAVRHEHRRYVGLMGSSVEDRLFLAQLIRYYCPDVHLFCLDNNLIYTNPRFNRYLEGMLIATPYPLYPQQNLWRREHGTLTAFPSDEANGTYMACRVILSRLNFVVNDQGEPQVNYAVAGEYGSPFDQDTSTPPVWVVQVGRGAILPLAVLPPIKNDCKYADEQYTLSLDETWNNERRARLTNSDTRDHNSLAGLLPKSASSATKSPANQGVKPLFEHRRLYDDAVAIWSLLILLGTIALSRKYFSAPTTSRNPATLSSDDSRPAAPPSHSTSNPATGTLATGRAINQTGVAFSNYQSIENWSIWLLLFVVASLQLLLLWPLVLTIYSYEWSWLWFYRMGILIAGTAAPLFIVFLSWWLREPAAYRWQGLRNAWESFAVPALCTITSLLVVGLALCAYFLDVNHEFALVVERACTPFARLCPIVPLAIVLVGFGLILASRAIRAQMMLDQQQQFDGWLPAVGSTERQLDLAPEVIKHAREAISNLDRQAALPSDSMAAIVIMAMIVAVTTSIGWVLSGTRLTLLSDSWEWAMRFGILGLSLVTICMISGCLSLGRAILTFLNAFDYSVWNSAFERFRALHPLVTVALKRQLFARTPAGFAPKGLDETDREWIGWLPNTQPADNSSAQDAEDPISSVAFGMSMLERLHSATTQSLLGQETITAIETRIRERLASQVAALTIFLLARLSRRLLMTFAVVILLMLALDSYPFQPHRFLLIGQWCVAGAAILVASYIFISLNLNPTLSALADNKQGMSLDANLLSQIALFVVAPLLTVLSLYFPELADFFGTAATAVKSVKL